MSRAEQDAFSATFSDFKLVKTRKVAQLIFEVPIEQVDAALKVLGGMPRSDAEAWVGIARLASPKPVAKEKTEGEKAVIRAALLAKESGFQGWVTTRYDIIAGESAEEHAADFIRHRCSVASRSRS